MTPAPHRLVTRSDFDGLVCAVLLRCLGLIDEITFVHPKDVQDGVVEVTERDILTNLPYAPEAHLVFDHHHSEMLRTGGNAPNHVIDPRRASAARVVYDHYGGSRPVSRRLGRADDARSTRPTRPPTTSRRSWSRRAGRCSTSSWTAAPVWAASAISGSRTTS